MAKGTLITERFDALMNLVKEADDLSALLDASLMSSHIWVYRLKRRAISVILKRRGGTPLVRVYGLVGD